MAVLNTSGDQLRCFTARTEGHPEDCKMPQSYPKHLGQRPHLNHPAWAIFSVQFFSHAICERWLGDFFFRVTIPSAQENKLKVPSRVLALSEFIPSLGRWWWMMGLEGSDIWITRSPKCKHWPQTWENRRLHRLCITQVPLLYIYIYMCVCVIIYVYIYNYYIYIYNI